MNGETEKLIQEAIAHLRLRDIILHEARFARPSQPAEANDQGIQQHKRGVKFTIIEQSDEDMPNKALHILVSLGTRVITGEESEQNLPVLFLIEADYLIIYEIIEETSQEAMKAFAEFNAVHNIWPFWRQHVYDIVQRAHLPHLDIPLFSGSI